MTQAKIRRHAGKGHGKATVSVARTIAMDVLEQVEAGAYAEDALSHGLSVADPGQPDRALATELVYGVLRWQRRLDDAIGRCARSHRGRIDAYLRHILRIGLYQILALDRIPHHAAVNEAVNQARFRGGERPGSFVNAVLRNALRNLATIDPSPGADPEGLAVYYSHPQWLVRQWFDAYGPEVTTQILIHNNSRATLDLRVNTLRTSRPELEWLLSDAQVQTEQVPDVPDALRVVTAARPVQTLPGFAEGLFAVQGIASQLIAPLLGARPGERILDACAAPGGKTAHLAALTRNEAEIVAADIHEARLAETRANVTRLAAERIDMRAGDARDPEFVRRLGVFDRILADPACTSLGVLRHNPEAKYRRTAGDSAAFARNQLAILCTLAGALEPRGTLLYSVCTITPEETDGVVRCFLAERRDFREDPIRHDEIPFPGVITGAGHLLTFPPSPDRPLDGFFAARFRRSDT